MHRRITFSGNRICILLLIPFCCLLEAIWGNFKIRERKHCAGSNQNKDSWRATCLSEWICTIFHAWRSLLSCYLYTLFKFDRFLSTWSLLLCPRLTWAFWLDSLCLSDSPSSLTVPVLIDFKYLFFCLRMCFRFRSSYISEQGGQSTISLLRISNRFSSCQFLLYQSQSLSSKTSEPLKIFYGQLIAD